MAEATAETRTASPPIRTAKGPKLGTRIFIATALLVILAVGLAVGVTYVVGNQVGESAARRALERSSKVQLMFQDQRFEQLRLMAYILAGDPNFSSYIQESIELDDAPSLLDQLDERREGLGFDFALLLDPDGMLLVRTDDPAARGEDFSGEGLYRQVMEDFEAVGGVWAQENQLFYAMTVPITAGDILVGFLVAAYAIDDQAAIDLREINNTEVAFLLRDSAVLRDSTVVRDSAVLRDSTVLRDSGGGGLVVAAKTLGPGAAEDLLAYLADHPGMLEASGSHHQVELQRQKWLALIRPLTDVAGEPIGAVVHLASLELELEPFRRIGSTLLAVGLLTMLIALVVSYLLPRRVLQPINRLAAAAKAAAEGDYDQEIKIDRGDEVGQLSGAFNILLSELREKRDMEIYVNELARTLPEPDAGAPEATPPERRLLTLVGLELRNYKPQQSFAPLEPRETLEQLTQDLRRIARAIRSQDGRIEATLGHRLIASFQGPRRSDRALSAAAEALSGAGSRSLELVAVLVTGQMVSGTTTWDNRPHYTLTGESIGHLEGLLRAARPGSLLMSSSAREELRATFEEAGVGLQEHRSTVSELPLFSLSADAIGRFAGPELATTRQLPDSPSGDPTGTVARSDHAVTLSGVGPGSVLADRFEILSELGAGGMGVVYKARDRTLGELVALKMLKQELWDDAGRMQRLKDELKIARKISHPNVLRTFDFGEADGFPFISMELVRGVTLRQLLDQSGRLPLSAGLRTSRQLCRGLAAAHAQGVLHRDIKPENLIIEANGNVKLMDFGIAKPLQRVGTGNTRAGVVIGTPYYLAPEQLEGQEADERADLYACGVVFYEIFTGALPFRETGNLMELITRKLQESPTPPREHWPNMPQDLERIILRCLESDPEQRYPDVDRLLTELEVLRA